MAKPNIWWPLKSVTITGAWANSPAFYAKYDQKGHNGIDLRAAVGTPVYASDAGVVDFEGWGVNHSWMGKPAGICVLVKHAWGYTGYAHLQRTVVNKGQKVKKGQLLGYSDHTGASLAPHLHWETLPLKPNFGNGFAGRVNPTSLVNLQPYGSTGGGNSSGTSIKGTNMKMYHKQDKDAFSKGRTIKPGTGIYLNTASGGPSNYSNIIGNGGYGLITAHVYAEGKAGDTVDVKLIWRDKEKGAKSDSGHYVETLVLDKNGQLKASRTFQRQVSKGWEVRLQAVAGAKNSGNVKITRFDSDAMLFL